MKYYPQQYAKFMSVVSSFIDYHGAGGKQFDEEAEHAEQNATSNFFALLQLNHRDFMFDESVHYWWIDRLCAFRLNLM